MIQIKKRFTGAILVKVDADTLREADLRGVDLQRVSLQGADLYGVNLHGADLYGVNLQGANLRRANLQGANLHGANLREADLYEANLQGADLYIANLFGVDLRVANLRGADLRVANLHGADLYGVDFQGADLRGADLRRAQYTVPQMLLASWNEVSDDLCCYMMRLDASAWPDGERLLSEWAAGGPCPATKTNGIHRVANFRERRKCWNRDLPPITLWHLWEMLAKEKDIKI